MKTHSSEKTKKTSNVEKRLIAARRLLLPDCNPDDLLCSLVSNLPQLASLERFTLSSSVLLFTWLQKESGKLGFFCEADINMFPKHLKWPFDCFSFYDSFLFNFYSKFSFHFFPVPQSDIWDN